MNDHKVILGEFENELYAEIAKKVLNNAGIKTKTLKKNDCFYLLPPNYCEKVTLIVSITQIEEAKKILKAKFI